MSLFGVLDTASRSLFVVQKGISTTAHNVSNADTPGYTRQRQVLAPERPVATSAGFLGTGVRQVTIERVNDPFIERQLLSSASAFGASDAQAQALSAIEGILNEQNRDGIMAALSDFYTSFSELESNPSGPVEREAVRAAGVAAVNAFQRADSALRTELSSLDRSVDGQLEDVNALLVRIADLNGAINDVAAIAPPNDLLDQRDQLIRDLSGYLDVSTLAGDNGQVTVTLSSGATLVQSTTASRLEPANDPTNPFASTYGRVEVVTGGARLDVTNDIGSGSIGGLLRARDTIVPAAIRSLDTVAYNLIVSVNSVHAAGTGLDGVSGRGFFVAPAQVEDAASSLAVRPEILANTDAIAAGQSSNAGDGRTAAQIAALRDTAAALFLPGDPPGPATGPTRTILEQAALLGADVGQQARDLARARDQDAQTLSAVQDRREEVAGVSLDEELTHLIRLQTAFQANARVIGVVQQLLDDMVSIL